MVGSGLVVDVDRHRRGVREDRVGVVGLAHRLEQTLGHLPQTGVRLLEPDGRRLRGDDRRVEDDLDGGVIGLGPDDGLEPIDPRADVLEHLLECVGEVLSGVPHLDAARAVVARSFTSPLYLGSLCC